MSERVSNRRLQRDIAECTGALEDSSYHKALLDLRDARRERDEAQRKLVENATKAVQDGVALVRQFAAANEALRWCWLHGSGERIPDSVLTAMQAAVDSARAAEGEKHGE